MRTITQDNAGFGVFLAFLLIPLSGLGTDIYLPSLPAMAKVMDCTPAQIQFSLTLFLIGYGLGQLFVGNFMDSFGRYRIGLAALFLFGASSLLIALTHSVLLLNELRLLQGMLAAMVVIAKRTFFVDVFSGAQLKRYLSTFTIVWSMGPIVAPFIGGYLQTSFGWQANFVFLAAFAWIVLVLEIWRGGETLRQPHRFHIGRILQRYRSMLADGAFMRGLVNVGLPYSGVMVYGMVAPFIIEQGYHLSPKVTGYASLVMGLAWMTGGFIAKSQLHRPLLDKHGMAVRAMLALVGLMLLTSCYLPSIYTLVLIAFLIHACCGMVFNIYFTECLGMFPQYAGLSGGLTGGIAFILTSALSYAAISVIEVRTQWQLGLVYLLFAVLSALMLLWSRRVSFQAV